MPSSRSSTTPWPRPGKSALRHTPQPVPAMLPLSLRHSRSSSGLHSFPPPRFIAQIESVFRQWHLDGESYVTKVRLNCNATRLLCAWIDSHTHTHTHTQLSQTVSVLWVQPKPTSATPTLNSALREAFNYEGQSYQLIYHFAPPEEKRDSDKMRRSAEGRRRSCTFISLARFLWCRVLNHTNAIQLCPSEGRREGGGVADLVSRRDEGDDELLLRLSLPRSPPTAMVRSYSHSSPARTDTTQ